MNARELQFVPAAQFEQRAATAVADAHLRKSFRVAMDFLIARRAAQFPDVGALERQRALAEQIRQYSLARLPDLLEQLERNLTENGIHVHWAEDAAEANAIIVGIARRHAAKRVVKGKSMVSEEVGLNHALEAAGIEALESDMGEYIVQLDGEKPSHIIMPAIHKTKEQIARLFAEKVPGARYTESVDELIGIGRAVLREKFMRAEIGLSGVNFAVAETGTLCLVENEGNGRMCTTVPEVHIAITGIEKVVEKLEHVPPLFGLLTRSATGQATTTYFNLISGPRKPGEKGRQKRRTRRPEGSPSGAARQRPHAGLRRRADARDAAMHPLRRVHEPLPGIYAHRRPRLRHHLPRPDRRNRFAAPDGSRRDARAADRVHAVRRLRRSLPGEHTDPRPARPPARRSAARRPTRPRAAGRPGRGEKRLDGFRLGRLGSDLHPPGALSRLRLAGDALSRPNAARAVGVDGKPYPTKTGGAHLAGTVTGAWRARLGQLILRNMHFIGLAGKKAVSFP